MRVCYVLAYRSPEYIRTVSIVDALKKLPCVTVFVAKNTACGKKRYWQTWRRVREIRDRFAPDVYILGFRGHEFYWMLRWLVGDKPIIFDALMSPYDALCSERKAGMLGRIVAPILKNIECHILQDAQLVLTDTAEHSLYFADTFSIPITKLLAIPVGAIEKQLCDCSFPHKDTNEVWDEMSVLFYGSFLPLHGVDVIIKAAKLLTELPIRFDFIGGGRKVEVLLAKTFPVSDKLRYSYRSWVSFNELIDSVIPHTDLCLGGPFGNTSQACRVVTGKTSQCLAFGKATVVGKINEDLGFEDKKNCLLVEQGDPAALADSIRWASKNRKQLCVLGINGRFLYEKRLSLRVVQEKINGALSMLKIKDKRREVLSSEND